ncbi:MAG: SusC/RagA family TonB-linked outer membrane protein [Porphyromonadaceae bacterium]|nr:MAG: SusC/RagA family TonB-linked outer membrane protein [Porphyromonadaceae bacterium]
MELKIAFLLILVSVSNLFAIPTYSQIAKVSLDMENKSLEQVMDEIERQSEFYFIFNQKQIDVGRIVSIQSENQLITAILPELFKGTNVNYVVLNRKILLTTDPLENRLVSLASEDEQQLKRITGTVTDKNGAPLPGTNVFVTGTSQGTTTDMAGKYSIEVPDGARSLTFSFVGMEPQTVVIGALTQINVTMAESAFGLDEVIVIGYGTVKKSDLTGSVSSISPKSLQQAVPFDVTRSLQGKASGVRVNQKSGRPGEDVIIRIRGGNSLSGGNNPLYVIDGFPVDNLGADFNPEDIASIEILKDASATAIYGSRGAGGVVLITTKRGLVGKTQINYHGSTGVQSLRKKIDLLGKNDFVAMQNEIAAKEGGSVLTAAQIAALPDNDWQDLTYRNADIQSHQLSVSGGNQDARFYSSINYLNQEGIILNSDFARISMRVNGDIRLNKKMTFKANISYTNAVNHNGNFAADGWGAIPFQAIVMPPTDAILDADGKFTVFKGTPWGGNNPVGYSQLDKSTGTLNRNVNNMEFQYDIIKGLSLRINAGVDFNNNTTDSYSKIGISNGGPGTGQASKSMNKSYSFVNENILNYAFNIKESHKFNATAVMAYQSSVWDQISGSTSGFVSNVFEDNNLQSGTKPNPPASSYTDSRLISYLGRFNYTLLGKYLVTLTGRYDGSSKFGKDNKYAFFPSAAIAWRMSEENFIKQLGWVSDLKLRASFGKAGNQAISSYQTLDRLSTNVPVFGTGRTVGFVSSGFANQSLRWETTQQADIGVDLSLFDNRIRFVADYYRKSTTDLLYNATLPPSSGYSSSTRNVGEIQNKGFEFELSYNSIGGPVRWETALNMSFNRGIVASLGTDNNGNVIKRIDSPIGGGNWFPLFLGEAPSQLYGFVLDGIYQTDAEANAMEPGKKAGDYKVKDLDGNGIINGDDQKMLSHLEPKFIFGMNQSISFKGFELAFQIVGSYGNEIVNEFNKYYTAMGGKWNVTQEAWDNRWTGPGSAGTYAAPSSHSTSYITFGAPSTLWIEPGSFLRFKDIRLSYSIPESFLRKIKISALSLYLSGTNLITWTNYPHYDPEASWTSSAVNGWDRGVYPSMKSVICGIQITF